MNKQAVRIRDNDEASGLGKPLPVKLSRILRFEDQPRRHFDQREIEDLADDLQENGQKTPVRVCRHSTQKGVFVLIGGERRWRAFGIIRDRTRTDPIVNCFIDVVNDEQHHFLEAFLDNLHRADLVPLDEAAAYKRLYDESTAPSHTAKIAAIARMVKKSVTHVENYVRMDSLSEPVKKYMDPLRPKDERLTTTAAIDIARSTPHAELQLTIAKEAIERNLGIVETRALIAVRTGKSGYGVGGRLRKPSDDYKTFKNFLGVTLNKARRIDKGLDLDDLYDTRDDEKGDRARDAELVRHLISYLNKMHEAIKGK